MEGISTAGESAATARTDKHGHSLKEAVDSLIDMCHANNTAAQLDLGKRPKVNTMGHFYTTPGEDRASDAFGNLEREPKAKQATIDLFTQYGGYTEEGAASAISCTAGIRDRR
jgi:hypothetical protein